MAVAKAQDTGAAEGTGAGNRLGKCGRRPLRAIFPLAHVVHTDILGRAPHVVPRQVFKLEELREKSLDKLVVKIQRAWRAFASRKWYRELRATTQDLLQSSKERRRQSVHRKYWGDYLQLKINRPATAMLQKQGIPALQAQHARLSELGH